jgi:hypothetical protein
MDVLDGMKLTAQRNLVKWAAGKAMFCPRCQDILDCKRTVVVDEKVLCAKCWDSKPACFELKEGVEVLDGRVLFGRVLKDAVPSKRKVKAAPRGAFGPLYRGYISRLKALGCVFCPTCFAYLNPHIHE